MSDAFQDRENTFEKQFVHDEDLHFRAVARRNKALALWVAEKKGLSSGEAEKYADNSSALRSAARMTTSPPRCGRTSSAAT